MQGLGGASGFGLGLSFSGRCKGLDSKRLDERNTDSQMLVMVPHTKLFLSISVKE